MARRATWGTVKLIFLGAMSSALRTDATDFWPDERMSSALRTDATDDRPDGPMLQDQLSSQLSAAWWHFQKVVQKQSVPRLRFG